LHGQWWGNRDPSLLRGDDGVRGPSSCDDDDGAEHSSGLLCDDDVVAHGFELARVARWTGVPIGTARHD
jgi:hypothetical protein